MTKMFTFVSNMDTAQRSRWHSNGSVKHARRVSTWTNNERVNASPALLLHSDDDADPITETDILTLMRHDKVQELFSGGVLIATPSDVNEGDWLLTTDAGYTDLPDQVPVESDPIIVYTIGGGATEIDLRQRYNDCRSLVKAVGCASCPEKGVTCLSRSRELDKAVAITKPLQMPADDDLKEKFKNRESIGAFTYVSPKLTIPEDHHFVPTYRHYKDHDFSRVQENSAKISEANTRAAEHRAFKKNSCSICPLQRRCSSYRNCAGPYPAEEEITRKQLAYWSALLQNTAPFTPWQFWAIARCGGADGEYRRTSHSRYAVKLHGLERSGSSWAVAVYRSRTDVGRIKTVTDYETLLAIFPGLPKTEEEAVASEVVRPANDQAVALYLMLTQHHRSIRYKGGWGGDYYGILYKRLTNEGVRVRFHGPRYHRGSTTIETYAQFYGEIHSRIGVEQIVTRIGKYRTD